MAATYEPSTPWSRAMESDGKAKTSTEAFESPVSSKPDISLKRRATSELSHETHGTGSVNYEHENRSDFKRRRLDSSDISTESDDSHDNLIRLIENIEAAAADEASDTDDDMPLIMVAGSIYFVHLPFADEACLVTILPHHVEGGSFHDPRSRITITEEAAARVDWQLLDCTVRPNAGFNMYPVCSLTSDCEQAWLPANELAPAQVNPLQFPALSTAEIETAYTTYNLIHRFGMGKADLNKAAMPCVVDQVSQPAENKTRLEASQSASPAASICYADSESGAFEVEKGPLDDTSTAQETVESDDETEIGTAEMAWNKQEPPYSDIEDTLSFRSYYCTDDVAVYDPDFDCDVPIESVEPVEPADAEMDGQVRIKNEDAGPPSIPAYVATIMAMYGEQDGLDPVLSEGQNSLTPPLPDFDDDGRAEEFFVQTIWRDGEQQWCGLHSKQFVRIVEDESDSASGHVLKSDTIVSAVDPAFFKADARVPMLAHSKRSRNQPRPQSGGAARGYKYEPFQIDPRDCESVEFESITPWRARGIKDMDKIIVTLVPHADKHQTRSPTFLFRTAHFASSGRIVTAGMQALRFCSWICKARQQMCD